MKIKYIVLNILLLSFSPFSFSQGKLLLAGGGNESQNGWSDTPYRWAIEQSNNKRVAIISYTSFSQWLANYFMQLGAKEAKNFVIHSRETANEQELFDSLMTYDVIFFSKGSINNYYLTYKETKLQKAIQKKFKQAGVIGGNAGGAAILSEFLFVEEKGNIKPEALLKDLSHSKILFKNDFLNLLKGFIIEPHFSERGHFARMLGFISHQWKTTGTLFKGIGIDDKTALCIDSNGQGSVHGTAAVHLYVNHISSSEIESEHVFFPTENLKLFQLLDGNSFNFNNNQSKGFKHFLSPNLKEEQLAQTLLLSGSNEISENILFLQSLIAQGDSGENILIVTGEDPTLANTVKAVLKKYGAEEVSFIQAVPAFSPEKNETTIINRADKILFVDNRANQLLSYLKASRSGKLLDKKMREAQMVVAFIGDDARLAGKSFIKNYQTKWASYEGKLEFQAGLGLLSTTAIMPNTFLNKDVYENTATGIPYLLVKDSLSYGIWLAANNFIVVEAREGITYLSSFGDSPSVLLKNEGANVGFVSTYRGANRNITGFDAMQISLLGENRIILGVAPINSTQDSPSIKTDWLTVYPNPVKDKLNLLFYGHQVGRFYMQLQDSQGRSLLTESFVVSPFQSTIRINVSKIPRGIHSLTIFQAEKRIVKKLRVIK